jgi:anti-sigma factor RsiW
VTRWFTMRRFTNTGGIPCERMREAISAEIDGEASDIRAKDVRFHLAHCEECLRFQTGTRALGRQVNLQSSRPVPADVQERLAIEMVRTVATAPRVSPRRSWNIRRASEWRRGARWVGALAPAAFVAVVLPLGALSTPREIPTHASTPCTISLRYLHRLAPETALSSILKNGGRP